jgi:plastocyanin
MRTIVWNMVIGAALAPILAWGALAAAAPPTTKLADNFFASKKAVKKGAKARPTKTIKLKDNFFAPSKKTVRRGTTVRFKWVGINAHNVVKASGPEGRFASRTTWRRGVNFAKKFRKTGTYRLVCTLHSGMELELKVVPRPRSAR